MTEISAPVWKTIQRVLHTKTFFRHSLYSNAAYILASRVGRSGLAFVFWFVAARLYPKQAVGLAATLSSAMMLMGTLSFLGLGQGLIRFLPETDRPRELINASFAMVTLLCGLVATVFVLGIRWWSPALADILTGEPFALVFICLSVGYILFEVLNLVFIGLRAAHNTLVITLFGGGLRIGLIFVAALVSRQASSLFAAYGAALLLAFLMGVIILLPRCLPDHRISCRGVGWMKLLHRRLNSGPPPAKGPQPALEDQYVRESPPILRLFRFSLGNYLNNLLWTAPARLFPLVVINTLGESAAADLYIAWLLGEAIAMASASLATSLFVEGSNASHRLAEDAKRSFVSGLLVTGLCGASLFVLARPALLVFGEEYSTEAVGLVRAFCLATFLGVIPTTYMAIARVRKWMGTLIGVSAMRAILGLAGGIWLTSSYGLSGLGVAWVGTQAIVAASVLVLMLGRMRGSGPIQRMLPGSWATLWGGSRKPRLEEDRNVT